MRQADLFDRGLVVDLFAGGGGASTGLEMAGLPVDIAINHDPRAIAMHEQNHPYARHYHCDIWEVDPAEATGGRPVAVLWASPDCTFFSKARGAAPHRDPRFANRRRSLATVVTHWAKVTRPAVIMLENVEEFVNWGPLDADGRPDKSRAGVSFRRWAARLRNLGYTVEWRNLRACDYGSPTSRKRLFIVCRRDRKPIVWPEASHGPEAAQPYRTAASIVDWTIPARSIFERRRPLADATMRRIARGVVEKVIRSPNPYIVSSLVHLGNGERPGQVPRVPGLDKPLGTVVAQGRKHALVSAYLARHWGGMTGCRLDDRPWPTITTKGCQDQVVELELGHDAARAAVVQAFLIKYYGTGTPASLDKPIDTLTTKARFGLVTVDGFDHQIVDIRMRMLTPRELYAAQGFPATYQIDTPKWPTKSLSAAQANVPRLGVTDQVFLAGNSVCPQVAAALASANVGGAS